MSISMRVLMAKKWKYPDTNLFHSRSDCLFLRCQWESGDECVELEDIRVNVWDSLERWGGVCENEEGSAWVCKVVDDHEADKNDSEFSNEDGGTNFKTFKYSIKNWTDVIHYLNNFASFYL